MSTPVQPTLDEMMARYLSRQADAEALGLAQFAAGEVQPYDSGPVQPIDPSVAWTEAQEAGRLLGVAKAKVLPGWSGLVAQREPETAVPLCLGNYPQMMRSFHILLEKGSLLKWVPKAGRTLPTPDLEGWALGVKSPAEALWAVAGLRVAGAWDVADRLVKAYAKDEPAWANERAALAWHRGESAQALEMWFAQDPSVPVRFNRGVAQLFLGQTSAARASLESAVTELPETGAWHHLGRLYLTLSHRA